MKIKISLIYRYSTTALLIAAIIMIFFLTYFVYQNIYKTVTETAVLLELRLETAIAEPLDFSTWNRIKESFKHKEQFPKTDFSALKNPFLK